MRLLLLVLLALTGCSLERPNPDKVDTDTDMEIDGVDDGTDPDFPTCVVDPRRIRDVTLPEFSVERSDDGVTPFRVYSIVNDPRLCGIVTFGPIDRIEVPPPIYDGGASVRAPDNRYTFDPDTGQGEWRGTLRDAPGPFWYIVIPVQGFGTVREVRVFVNI